MTPAEAREINRLEFEAEAAAIRQRAYALVQQVPIKTPAPKAKPAAQRKRNSNPNGRPAKRYTVGDITLPLSAWAVRVKMTPRALYQRLKKGWTIEQAVATPAGQRQPQSTVH